MKMIDRHSLITAKYPKNLLYMVIQFDFCCDIFEFLPIKESTLVQNIDKAFSAIRYNVGNDKLSYINRSIKITTLYFNDEIPITQIARSYNISNNEARDHIIFILKKLRNPVYWNIIMHGEISRDDMTGSDPFDNSIFMDDSYASITSDNDFYVKSIDMRKKNYPRSLYYDIFEYGINYNYSTFVVPEDSIIEANINMALEEYDKNNTHPDYDHMITKYLIMYYKYGMSSKEIAAAAKKHFMDIDKAINYMLKILRTPRYSYIISHGKVNPDYINIDNGISVLNLDARYLRLLYARNIRTIDWLVCNSREEILQIYGIGPAAAKKIEDALSSIGLSLGMDKAYKKYIYSTDDVDIINKMKYDLSYEDACELLLQIRSMDNNFN